MSSGAGPSPPPLACPPPPAHRWYRNVIQRIHAYHWQQQGWEGEDQREGREDRREGWEDRREGEGRDRREEAPHQLELQQIEKI